MTSLPRTFSQTNQINTRNREFIVIRLVIRQCGGEMLSPEVVECDGMLGMLSYPFRVRFQLKLMSIFFFQRINLTEDIATNKQS